MPENELYAKMVGFLEQMSAGLAQSPTTVRSRGSNMTGYNKTGPCTMTILSMHMLYIPIVNPNFNERKYSPLLISLYPYKILFH
jgi:hypothetical protein